jgi:hypothetical protein
MYTDDICNKINRRKFQGGDKRACFEDELRNIRRRRYGHMLKEVWAYVKEEQLQKNTENFQTKLENAQEEERDQDGTTR